MGFDEGTVQRIRDELFNFNVEFEEKKMFGGMVFLYEGKMAFGVIDDQFVVRLHPDQQASVLETYDYVFPSVDMNEDSHVRKSLKKSFAYVKSLPPKKSKLKN